MSLLEIYNEYPLLVPSIGSKLPKVFHGFISICGADTEFHVIVPEYPSPKDTIIKTNVRVTTILHKCKYKIHQIQKESRNFLEYLKKVHQLLIEELLSEATIVHSNWLSSSQVDVFTRLLQDLEQLGWDNVTHVDPNFTFITLQEKDVKERIHKMRLKIPPDYPAHVPLIEAQLPTEFNVNWNAGGGLNSVVAAWKQQIFNLQLFWDIMDELDHSALILDPPDPGPQHTTRRILLGNHVSVQLNINVSHPRSMPHCHLLGSAQIVAPLNTKLTNSFQICGSQSLEVMSLESLMVIKEVTVREFPYGASKEGKISRLSIECFICFCMEQNQVIPNKSCKYWNQPRHQMCL
ncbi:unnamed protein product, partial [Meganyctiphanes norvegica]